MKDWLGIDITNNDAVKKVGDKSAIIRVSPFPAAKPALIRIGSLSVPMQFTSSAKAEYDIVQNVTWTTATNGTVDPKKTVKIIEGWQVDKDGKQQGIDRHMIAGEGTQLNVKNDNVYTITGVFQLGVGTVTGKPQTEHYVTATGPAANAGVKFADGKPSTTYKVVFTINKDGSYEFIDESIGIDIKVDKDGKLTKGDLEKTYVVPD